MSSQIIRNLKDVAAVCKASNVPCRIQRIDETHDKGYMGVRLVVGQKLNPVYDVNADPNRPGLTVEDRIVEEYRSKIKVADVRITWIRPGMTYEEFNKEFLVGIKSSIERQAPIVEVKKTNSQNKPQKSLDDLANELEKDGGVDSDVSDFDDEEDEMDVAGFDDENSVDDEEDDNEEEDEPVKKENKADESDIVKALQAISANMQTLAGDINLMNDNISHIDERLTGLENETEKKPKKNKKKK